MRKTIIILFLTLMAWKLSSQNQEHRYVLQINLRNDTCYISIVNNTKKTIEIENPSIFKERGFLSSSSWKLIMNDGINHCFEKTFYENTNLPIKDLILKIKGYKNYNFSFSLNIKDIECANEIMNNIYFPSSVKIQLKVKLDKPKGIILESNIIDLRLD